MKQPVPFIRGMAFSLRACSQYRRPSALPHAFKFLGGGADACSVCPPYPRKASFCRSPLCCEPALTSMCRELFSNTSISGDRVAQRLGLQPVLIFLSRQLQYRQALFHAHTASSLQKSCCRLESASSSSGSGTSSAAGFSSASRASSPPVATSGQPTRPDTAGSKTLAADDLALQKVSKDAAVCSIADTLVNMVKSQVHRDSRNVTLQMDLESLLMRDDRHWDCLDTVEFLLDVEELFGIVIPDEVADGVRTIEDIANFVTRRGSEVAAAGAQLQLTQAKP